MSEAEQRAAVIAEAKSWLRTPYHHMGRLKGIGADCATFPAEVYAACKVIPPVEIGFYPPDWHLHRSEEKYLARVLDYAPEVAAPQPGDFVLWRIGRALAHGAIVIGWPKIIHAVVGIGVILDSGDNAALSHDRRLGKREVHFYSPWAKQPAAPAKAAA